MHKLIMPDKQSRSVCLVILGQTCLCGKASYNDGRVHQKWAIAELLHLFSVSHHDLNPKVRNNILSDTVWKCEFDFWLLLQVKLTILREGRKTSEQRRLKMKPSNLYLHLHLRLLRKRYHTRKEAEGGDENNVETRLHLYCVMTWEDAGRWEEGVMYELWMRWDKQWLFWTNHLTPSALLAHEYANV